MPLWDDQEHERIKKLYVGRTLAEAQESGNCAECPLGTTESRSGLRAIPRRRRGFWYCTGQDLCPAVKTKLAS